MRPRLLLTGLGAVILLIIVGAACVPSLVDGPVDSYVALAPQVLRAGQTEAISLALFHGDSPSRGNVQVSLLRDGRTVAHTYRYIKGNGIVPLQIPRQAKGNYRLQVSGRNFQDQAPVRVERGALLFLETDKPIYKPGQTVHVRVLTLDPLLKPLSDTATVEVQDAKGIKIFRKEAATDDFGMLSIEFPLSSEPNMGTWKISARSEEAAAQLDIRVEEYVLPKYEVVVDLPRDWVLAGDPITGTVSAMYSFGKPVKGEVEIVASRYVGVWEEFATLVQALDGEAGFELPAAGYVAGVPGAGGLGNVTLDVSVRERATGYEEKTTHLLTVAATPVNLQVIPESGVFKPTLPFTFLVLTETPDNQPLDEKVDVVISYMDEYLDQVRQETRRVTTENGKALLKLTPPEDAVALTLEATTATGGDSVPAHASLALEAGYSPSGNFIHVEQVGQGTLGVGDTARFRVHSTGEAANFYYEVIARGRLVFSDTVSSHDSSEGGNPGADIDFRVTPVMAPGSRLLVYQVLPNSEVAADYLPFQVDGEYPHHVRVGFSKDEVGPGDEVDIEVETQGEAKVGLVAVDRSVFILAENRLNLRQVFAELERLYLEPQVELHEVRFLDSVTVRGAEDTFKDVGLTIMTNKDVPQGEEYSWDMFMMADAAESDDAMMAGPRGPRGAAPTPSPAPMADSGALQPPSGLAEVQRVRQFFPETWLWTDVTTIGKGRAAFSVEAPDSITTWALRGVALSKEHGLGIGEAELRVFQPFFLQVDLPFSAIRGEEFPVKIALYNYLDSPQEIFVEMEVPASPTGTSDTSNTGGNDLLNEPLKTVTVGPNDIGGVEFLIRPTGLGNLPIKVSARSAEAADAVIKDLLVEPEGVQREVVDNLVISSGDNQVLDTSVPGDVVDGSARAYVALTGSYLTQTIEGLEGLLRMPFGCGEQNMILFAPNVFVAQYLKNTGQLKPEVMARAEHLMITGYQRELTYRRQDGSFSAFGESDSSGSLWLTAFVLKTFAQAQGLIYVDPAVLDDAASWIIRHQRSDGSFEPVGFLHHRELLGGLQGNTALTAYIASALLLASPTPVTTAEAGTPVSKAMGYLEGQLAGIEDPYTMSIVAYALELTGSGKADSAYEKLMGMAQEDEEGLHWAWTKEGGGPSAAVETTGYATLALLERGDSFNASRAARWLVSQRNAFGGFSSTQDTVVGLQALTRFAASARDDIDMTVTLTSGEWRREISITPENADVLQTIQVPLDTINNSRLQVEAQGDGQAVLQLVRRYNLPDVEADRVEAFQISVGYGTGHVEVDDLITVSVDVQFTPPEPLVPSWPRITEAGMVVLDIAVPTGFSPVDQSIRDMIDRQPPEQRKVKRYDVAGRKVILYIEDMAPGESLSFRFQARALYPVRAQAVTSSAYAYYKPALRGEALGGAMVVEE